MESVKYNGTTMVNYNYNTADLYTMVLGSNYCTSYIYDNAMRITGKTNNFIVYIYIEEFTYDALSRLTGYTGDDTGIYTYDAAGNMTGMSITSSTGDRTVPRTKGDTPKLSTNKFHHDIAHP